MAEPTIHAHFLAIWRRALNQPSLETLTPSLIASWASVRGLQVQHVEERDVGAFAPTTSIVLSVPDGRACFPKVSPSGDQAWQRRRDHANRDAATWAKMEWFSPLWVPRGKVESLLKETANCSQQRAVELFDYHTSTIYTLAFQATCIAQLLPQARSLREFCPLAREAYLAFYSGYRASSIAALIPVIEGSLTRIVSGANLSVGDRVDRAVAPAIELAAQLHFERMWVPREYKTVEYLLGQDERVFFFETFRRWLRSSFFRRTDEYDGATWLNRHMFAHATSSSWQQSANFARLVVALVSLGVVESWHDESNQVSLFFPDMNEDSTLLWQQALFYGQAQSILKQMEAQRYHDHGRLVPELPTDNGVLLRKAILSEDCINDLVRPLREAGWNVAVGEPDERALYVTVAATAGDERLRVALLYSCATANEIYRQLALTSDAILYRGGPYRQDQYAYGVTIHVGPVAGWQPPTAPDRRRD
ncbi:hypothetical protein WME98_24705 [Sorangium sp. So ce296]|uniref:hypothetical protein n=1 Tax=Sorangium sp. So ce296 TaxID=3133296 RepID=UPI003F604588